MSTYSDSFFRDLDLTAEPSARRILPLVMELLPVRSAVDVGCGDGGWLAALIDLGVDDVLGLDGPWIGEEQLKIPREQFRRVKLDGPLGVECGFDLAISLEVAEHLPPERADGFVAELTRMAPVVLFSAAIPGQGGVNHLNEQWPAYWSARFGARQFRTVDCLRLRIWNDPAVTWWYKENIMLFASATALAAYERLAAAAGPEVPPSLIYPERFEAAVRLGHPRIGRWLKMAPSVIRRSFDPRRP